MQARFMFAPALTLAALLAACSAKVTPVGGAIAPRKPDTFTHAVQGPLLDGHWKSACQRNRWDNDYVTYEMTISGQSVKRVTQHFTDSQCGRPAQAISEDGLFRYVKQYVPGTFEVEYRMNMTNGTYDFPEVVKLEGGTLWISDHVAGESVIPDIPLNAIR